MILRFLTLVLRPFAAWKSPSTKLAELVARAHHGEISVEEMLSSHCARKKLAPLAGVMASVLLDLKQQRAERAELDQEIRDRIANRTDALERRIGSLQVQATRDSLTGLGNRRGLDAALPRMLAEHRDAGINICLLMIDVDHFKPLNDTLGHPAGDQLLKDIGQLIRSTLRGNDQAYRCGGDEFVILLHDCNLQGGALIARRLEAVVKALTKPLAVAHPPQLSIGIASASELKNPTAEMLIQCADSRLYAVKATRPRTRRSA